MSSEASVVKAMSDLSVGPTKDRPWEEIVAEKKPYYDKRITLFEGYRQRELKKIEDAKAANVPIKIVLPDGGEKKGVQNVTTPFDVANEISKSLAKKCVVAKVDGATWDLFRPLEDDCTLSLHSFDDAEGRDVSSRVIKIHVCMLISSRMVLYLKRGVRWDSGSDGIMESLALCQF